MSTTVTYKGSTLTTVENATKKLTTAGTWLEDDITIQDTPSGGGAVNDFPTFNTTWDSLWEEITSITCDKTYSECLAYYNSGNLIGAIKESNGTEIYTYTASLKEEDGDLAYVACGDLELQFDLVYSSNNEITFREPSEYAEVLEITQNGYYTPQTGIITGVGVAVAGDIFVVILGWNETTEIYEPDCTWAELNAAYNGNKNIVVCVNDQPSNIVADGSYNPIMERYEYVIRKRLYSPANAVLEQAYYFNSSGVTKESEQIYVEEPTLQTITKIYTPTESQQTEQITAGSGYDAIEEVDVTVNAIPSTYVGTGIARKSSSDLTQSNATVTAPAGYYESAATKTIATAHIDEVGVTIQKNTTTHVATVRPFVFVDSAGFIGDDEYDGDTTSISASELVSGTLSITSSGLKDVTNYASASVAAGTEGTPSATKGTVSNHSVSVTPSVTNTAGYITGGTKTGTAVSVSASELVSGSETKTANGTYDVTNLASLVVAIPFSTITASSSNPTGGNNGDVWIQTA